MRSPETVDGADHGGAPPQPDHPDRLRWNARYRDGPPAFVPHPLVAQAQEAGIPDGPVLELACGPSGSALALAAAGRSVVAVDVSDVALGQLAAEAERRGLGGRIECVEADVPTYDPGPGRFALVLGTRYWDTDAFRVGCAAVTAGGLIGWEALVAERPRRWHVRHAELGARLPHGFRVLTEELITQGSRHATRLLARAPAPAG